MAEYILPEFGQDAFNCPHCGTYSRQIWINYLLNGISLGTPAIQEIGLSNLKKIISERTVRNLCISFCEKCKAYVIWNNGIIVYPNKSIAPIPSKDTPKEILDDYKEASNIFEKSPRSSAALLRLVIQKLLVVLGEKGRNINDDIASLVSKGLPVRIQKALDIVRVVGNNAVHPGTIDINDNPKIAFALFNLVNLIIDFMITQPKEIDNLYSSLPQGALEAIQIRDSK